MSGERQFDDEAAAHRRTARLAYDSMMKVNRRDWTDEQWIADARQLMDHIDGSAACLLNGHIHALFRAIDAAPTAQNVAEVTERSDHTVHLVRAGRYPHVIERRAGLVVRQSQRLDAVTCGVCLATAGEFLAGVVVA